MMLKTARLSSDGLYRYDLTRIWGDPSRLVNFVMLNPSTADAEQDDPTIRRCIGFARSWGYDGIKVTNLYALRATRPVHLWEAAHPVGPENDDHLRRALVSCALVIASWGVNARQDRVEAFSTAVRQGIEVFALGFTKAGAPRHPLYVKGDATPVLMWPPAGDSASMAAVADVRPG